MGTNLRIDDSSYLENVQSIGDIYAIRLQRPLTMYRQLIYYYLTITGWKERRLVKKLHHYTNSIIKERQERLDNFKTFTPLLDSLLKEKNEGADINDEGIREELETFLFAGHDTTSSTLSYTLLLLANNKQIQVNTIIQKIKNLVILFFFRIKYLKKLIQHLKVLRKNRPLQTYKI